LNSNGRYLSHIVQEIFISGRFHEVELGSLGITPGSAGGWSDEERGAEVVPEELNASLMLAYNAWLEGI
jgi:hypothetical protein